MFCWDCIKFIKPLGEADVFIISNLPVHKHDVHFHFFKYIVSPKNILYFMYGRPIHIYWIYFYVCSITYGFFTVSISVC